MIVCVRRIGWNRPFFIVADDECIIDFFVHLYNGKVCCDQGIDGIIITVISSDDLFLVNCNGKTITTEAPIQTVLNLMFEESAYRTNLFPVHGGIIESQGKAHLFLAPTHIGKTTLIAYLTHSGYPYINDDFCLIDMDTLFVVPDITPIHLRVQSLPILEQHGCFISGDTMATERDIRIVYTPPHTQSNPLPISAIYFIERDERKNNCVPMEKSQSVKSLMAALLSPTAVDADRLRCAIRLAPKCKRLVYSDMGYVADLLAERRDS